MLSVSAVGIPGLARVEKSGAYHCKVDLQLSDALSPPDISLSLQKWTPALPILSLTSAWMYPTLKSILVI